MDALNDRGVTNKLRAVVANAEGGNYLSASEAGFIVTLVERFRTDVEKKLRQMAILQGELNQLKTNEQIIISLVENIVAENTLTSRFLTSGPTNDNQVVLTQSGISRQHARVERTQAGWQITDLGSTNGTYLDRQKLLSGIP